MVTTAFMERGVPRVEGVQEALERIPLRAMGRAPVIKELRTGVGGVKERHSTGGRSRAHARVSHPCGRR